MFSKISRYRPLADVVTIDAAGRRLSSRDLRATGPVTGRYQHTLADGDRLDALAAHYYRQPRSWWRICDANTDYLSPQELVGAEPVLICRFEMTGTPTAALVRAVSALVGVDRAVLEGDTTLLVTFNRLNLSVQDIAAVFQAGGHPVVRAVQAGRTGKPIVIPPDISG
ncbi:hypothetical protein ACIBG8_42955 [Nonomuraea sp. NPDC050556]|uniref:hypothetical protein n=1 Tax=Nonomuraea sp. NPDC050556 TaxID=3364369 RepID=UPI00378AD870